MDLNFSVAISGASSAELAAFNSGKTQFNTAEDVDEGLGPVFNDVSCGACHNESGLGGGSRRVETRWGKFANGVFDPLASKGGSLQQDQGIGQVDNPDGSFCTFFNPEAQPSGSNVLAQRRTTPLFGLGLVDATPDSTFTNLANSERSATLRSPAGQHRHRRGFGCHARREVRLEGSGRHAAFVLRRRLSQRDGHHEPSFPKENCPKGNCAQLNCLPDKGLVLDDEDGADVDEFTNFTKFLRPRHAGTTTAAVTRGHTVFVDAGCAFCHVETLTSGSNASAALSKKTIIRSRTSSCTTWESHGDGIGGQGRAGIHEMRTAPLWGLRGISRFIHGGTEPTLVGAINQHGGQGQAAKDFFNQKLTTAQQNDLVAFLNSL